MVDGNDDRIVGGKTAESMIYYQVSCQDSNGNHFCGASILSDKWLLSAAHCYDPSKKPNDNLNDFVFKVGKIDNTDAQMQV